MIQQNPVPSRLKILVFSGVFLPGFRGGGPIRSLANLIETLSGDFDFWVITTDRDLGEKEPFPGVVPDVWAPVGKAQVMYLSHRGQVLHRLWKLIRNTPYDAIYLNSFFARRFSMFPFALWRFGLIKHTPLVLAPRGEFSSGALELKPLVKKAYLAGCNLLGWYQSKLLLWQASSEFEAEDISRVQAGRIISGVAPPIADNTPLAYQTSEIQPSRLPKIPGSLSLIFLSRISRKKNLDFALHLLAAVSGNVSFDICGPIEDVAYWRECQALIAELPPTIKVRYLGEVPHNGVSELFRGHHLFLFPTRGENYGHVICEALLAGCPVILSDQTPWRNLQSLGVGWDLPLNDISTFHDALQQCVDMDYEEYAAFSSRAKNYGLARSSDEEVVRMSRQLFQSALGMRY